VIRLLQNSALPAQANDRLVDAVVVVGVAVCILFCVATLVCVMVVFSLASVTIMMFSFLERLLPVAVLEVKECPQCAGRV
jgi:hypothetical protein